MSADMLHAHNHSSTPSGLQPLAKRVTRASQLVLALLLLSSPLAHGQRGAEPSALPAPAPLAATPSSSHETPELSADSEPTAPPDAQDEGASLDPAPADTRERVVPTRRFQKQLTDGEAYTRTWTRSVTRVTRSTRNARVFSIDDNTSQRIKAQISYHPNYEGHGFYEITVLEIRPSPPSQTLIAELPPQGARLRCVQQRTDEISCVDRLTGAAAPWPAWALLEFPLWPYASELRARQRWSATVENAALIGWPHDESDELRAQLSVADMDDPRRTHFSGTLSTHAHLSLLGVELPYELKGTLSGSFNHIDELLDTVEFHLNAHIEHQGSSYGVPWTWHRLASSHLKIETEL